MTMVLAHIADVLPAVLSPKRVAPRTLVELTEHFEELEADERPDVDVPMRALRLTPECLLEVPERRESFVLSDWSRHQLSTILGVRWSTWFNPDRVSAQDCATEVNRRLQANGASFRLRTSRSTPSELDASGTLRALVSPLYTPIRDSSVTRMLRAALEATFNESLVVSRVNVEERSTTFVVRVGDYFDSGSSLVGAISGGLTWTNSHVGFRSASLFASLERLVCRNGLRLPCLNAGVWRRAHRAFTESKFSDALLERLAPLPNAFKRAARVLVEARGDRVNDVTAVFRQLLQAARVPLKFLSEVERAFAAEPDLEPSPFAVSQAITRAAQQAEPAARDELERVAGQYLANLYRNVD
jgi:hypothetical protein